MNECWTKKPLIISSTTHTIAPKVSIIIQKASKKAIFVAKRLAKRIKGYDFEKNNAEIFGNAKIL